jgi:WD40 repeat protein
MSKNISFIIACLLALTPSLYSTKVPPLEELVSVYTIKEALSNNKFLQDLIRPELEVAKPEAKKTKRESPELPPERREELKQILINTYKLSLIDLFKDYSVKRLQGGILIAFSSDGTKVLTESDSGSALIWDLTKQQPTFIELKGYTGRITSIALSSDGTKALTGSKKDQTARLWDATTGKLLATLHAGSTVLAAFSPDGNQAFTRATDGSFQLWDITHQEHPTSIILQDHPPVIVSAAFSPDGKKILTGSTDGTVQLWDITKREQPTSIALQGHTKNVSSVTFSLDGNKALTGSEDGTVRLWDITKEEPTSIVLQGHAQRISSVAFSLDGKKALTGSYDKTARLWDITKEEPTSIVLKGHAGPIISAVFSPDGTLVFTGSIDETARLWDITKQQPTSIVLTQPAPPIGPMYSVAFSPNGRYALTGAWLWDLVEPMVSLTLAQLLIVLKLKQDSKNIHDKNYRTVYETLNPKIKAYLQRTLNLQL